MLIDSFRITGKSRPNLLQRRSIIEEGDSKFSIGLQVVKAHFEIYNIRLEDGQFVLEERLLSLEPSVWRIDLSLLARHQVSNWD